MFSKIRKFWRIYTSIKNINDKKFRKLFEWKQPISLNNLWKKKKFGNIIYYWKINKRLPITIWIHKNRGWASNNKKKKKRIN